MIHSIPDISDIGAVHNAARRSQQVRFLPHERISLTMTIGSFLLGVALLCPSYLFLALFSISPHTKNSNLEFVLFPWTAILLHVLLGPLLEEVVYRGLFCNWREDTCP
jgi:membrane protease YdiL (CAAX protease family)